MGNSLDPQVVALLRAIRQQESGGNYNAKSKDGGRGAFQFTGTWNSWAGRFLGDPNAQMTRANQNKVAYMKILELKNKGYNPGQIAAAWNAGEGSLKNDAWKRKVGVNSAGVRYDTPKYVRNVYSLYRQFVSKMKQNG